MISESGGRNYHGCSLGIYQPGDPRRLRCSGVRSGGGEIHQLVTSTDGTSGATRALRRTAAHSGALPRYDFSPQRAFVILSSYHSQISLINKDV